jgi:uncharacterized membrane protein (UPF0127 family)
MFLEPGRDFPRETYTLRQLGTGQVLAARAEIALTRADRNRGLLGRDHLPAGDGLVLAPCFSIHTAFMRFPIDVIFVKRDGRVVKTSPAVPAWRMRVGWGAYAVVELPAGTMQQAGLKAGDMLELL